MTSRPMRVLRGAIAAGVSVFTALFTHVVLGGGAMPGWLGVVLPLAFALPICVALAGRRVSAVRVALSVAASQVLYNALFVLGSPTATVVPGSGHHGGASIAGASVEAIAPGATMWGAHVVAGAATVVLLFVAERCVGLTVHAFAAVRAWLDRLISSGGTGTSPIRSAPLRTASERMSAVSAVAMSSVRRRGPPLLATF